ncbi:unnamed protein product, partial [Choristocarpus tenellus]
CHSEKRRVVPRYVVNRWDFSLHRVCHSAALFLDATRFLPVIKLSDLRPELHQE